MSTPDVEVPPNAVVVTDTTPTPPSEDPAKIATEIVKKHETVFKIPLDEKQTTAIFEAVKLVAQHKPAPPKVIEVPDEAREVMLEAFPQFVRGKKVLDPTGYNILYHMIPKMLAEQQRLNVKEEVPPIEEIVAGKKITSRGQIPPERRSWTVLAYDAEIERLKRAAVGMPAGDVVAYYIPFSKRLEAEKEFLLSEAKPKVKRLCDVCHVNEATLHYPKFLYEWVCQSCHDQPTLWFPDKPATTGPVAKGQVGLEKFMKIPKELKPAVREPTEFLPMPIKGAEMPEVVVGVQFHSDGKHVHAISIKHGERGSTWMPVGRVVGDKLKAMGITDFGPSVETQPKWFLSFQPERKTPEPRLPIGIKTILYKTVMEMVEQRIAELGGDEDKMEDEGIPGWLLRRVEETEAEEARKKKFTELVDKVIQEKGKVFDGTTYVPLDDLMEESHRQGYEDWADWAELSKMLQSRPNVKVEPLSVKFEKPKEELPTEEEEELAEEEEEEEEEGPPKKVKPLPEISTLQEEEEAKALRAEERRGERDIRRSEAIGEEKVYPGEMGTFKPSLMTEVKVPTKTKEIPVDVELSGAGGKYFLELSTKEDYHASSGQLSMPQLEEMVASGEERFDMYEAVREVGDPWMILLELQRWGWLNVPQLKDALKKVEEERWDDITEAEETEAAKVWDDVLATEWVTTWKPEAVKWGDVAGDREIFHRKFKFDELMLMKTPEVTRVAMVKGIGLGEVKRKEEIARLVHQHDFGEEQAKAKLAEIEKLLG